MLFYQLVFTHLGAIFIMASLALLNNSIFIEDKAIRTNKMLKNYIFYMIFLNISYVLNINIKIQLAIILFDLYCNLPSTLWWRIN